MTVRPGYEGAVAAALGAAADAVAVTDTDSAVAAIDHLKSDDLGRAGLLLGGGEAESVDTWPALPTGTSYAAGVVECPAQVRPALDRLLRKVAVVDDLPAARALVADLPDVVAVTRDGDLLGAHFASGGSNATQSLIEIQAAVDEATEALAEAVAAAERLAFDLARLESERAEAQQRADVALAKLARVRRDPGRRGRGAWASTARSPGLPGPRPTGSPTPSPRRRASREQALVGLAEPGAAPRCRRAGRRRGGAGHHRAGAPRRGHPRGPAERDGGAAGVAHLRGARPCPARPGRADAQGSGGRACRPGPGGGAPGAADRRGPGRSGGGERGVVRPGAAGGLRRPGGRAPAGRRGLPPGPRAGA
ncbi:hypothetical protein [Nocardioides convexus]|uniref:hypothetical protein n=1 Tax=Nocardioides convexus TaxID=2712224 RepID=UPI00241864BC|nr:hypothetical protein [Nocardioides convexus]